MVRTSATTDWAAGKNSSSLAAQQRAFERLSPEAKTDRLMRLARGGRG